MKILYQEKDPEFRSYVSMVLETAFDAEIIEVANDMEGATLLEFEDINTFDLVISDYHDIAKEESLFYQLKKLRPNIPFVYLVEPAKNENQNLKNALSSFECTIKINKPFKDTDFFPVVEKLLSDSGANLSSDSNASVTSVTETKTLDVENAPDEKNKSSENYVDHNDFTPANSKKKIPIMTADWEIEKKEYHKGAEESADWSLEKKKNTGEVSADWEIERKEYKKGAEESADWSLAKEEQEDQVEADWSLDKKEKIGREETADWSLVKDGEDEGDADWSLAKDKKGGEEDADWNLNKNKQDGEELDYSKDKNLQEENELLLDGAEKKQDEELDVSKTKKDNSEENLEIERKKTSEEDELSLDKNSPSEWILEKKEQAQSKNHTEISHETPDYIPVKIELFFQFNDVNCDVFINLSKTKFLKIINASDIYDQDQLKRYQDKGKDVLYIKGADAKGFYDYIEKSNQGMLKSDDVNVQSRKLGIFREKIHYLGIDNDLIETTNLIVNTCISSLKSQPDLFNHLDKFMKKEDYISEHSLMCAYISHQMLKKMNWSNEVTIQKLTLACLFHDISLNDEYLAYVSSLEDKNYPLDAQMKEIVRNHPLKSAEILNQMKQVIPDVDTIIRQHHERPDGSGFPKGLSAAEIQPLACIMIIAEDFTNRVYDTVPELIDLDTIKSEYDIIYSKGNFKKVLEAFKLTF